MKSRYTMFAAYNAWANERLYDAAARLSDADYRADRGAFFKSVHGTLNHLLLADRIWMRRFTGSGEHPDRLDAILYDAFAELRAARRAEDARIRHWIEAWAMPTSRARCATAPSSIRAPSSSRSRPRSTISSITRRITAARRTACSPASSATMRRRAST